MAVPRFVRYAGQGYVAQYIHLGGKIAVQVEFAGVTPETAGQEAFTTLAKEVAMHVAAANPTYVSRGAVHEELGNEAAARADYRKALEIVPDHEDAKEALARLGN